jgi:hypothetical protein
MMATMAETCGIIMYELDVFTINCCIYNCLLSCNTCLTSTTNVDILYLHVISLTLRLTHVKTYKLIYLGYLVCGLS